MYLFIKDENFEEEDPSTEKVNGSEDEKEDEEDIPTEPETISS